MKVCFVVALLAGLAPTVCGAAPGTHEPKLCSPAWNQMVEKKLATGDGRGHGPDIGCDEWKYVVEFKLGLRGKSGIPAHNSIAWCAYIDKHLRSQSPAQANGPAFACDKADTGSIAAMICGDGDLSALDRKLAGVYATALKKAANEHPPRLKAGQRGWLKGRDDCWKNLDKRACVRSAYVRRIAELQAAYRMVPGRGPFSYACNGNPANKVIATFFQTDPPTLVAEHGDSMSLMFQQPSGSGARYQGRNESFWEHHGEAAVVWGYGAPAMKCKVRK